MDRHFKVLLPVIIIVVTVLLFPNDWQEILFTPTSPSDPLVVTEVVDGDTIKLANGETVRYIGINTPETKHPQKGVECFGTEASQKNEELVLGHKVELEFDVSETDRYGRVLAYVWVDGEMINETLVRQGYAHAATFPPDVKYQNLFIEAEQDAREHNRGLWGGCE